MQKELVRGESFTVPETPADVRLDTARPDALTVTIGGAAVPPLADRQVMLRDVPVSAAALLARAEPASAPSTSSPPPAPRRDVQRSGAPSSRPDSLATQPAQDNPATPQASAPRIVVPAQRRSLQSRFAQPVDVSPRPLGEGHAAAPAAAPAAASTSVVSGGHQR